VVVPDIRRLEKMQVQVYNALTNSQMNDTMRKRAILPRRLGGIVPGSSPVAAAAYVASASQFEAFVYNLIKRMGERNEEVPFGIKCLWMRMGGRNNLIKKGNLTSIELQLKRACDNINGTAAKHETLASRKTPTFNPPRTVVPGGYVSGPAGGNSTRGRRGQRIHQSRHSRLTADPVRQPLQRQCLPT